MMALTAGQLAAIKADIVANGDLNVFPNSNDGNFEIARLYNLAASPDWFVWSTSVEKQTIKDNITWANFTPNDTPDTITQWTNRAIQCYGKRDNVWSILEGVNSFDASKTNQRGGLQDALTSIPSGNAGANRSGGWNSVQLILSRKTSRIEKVLSTGTGSQATPATMGYEGQISPQQIEDARK